MTAIALAIGYLVIGMTCAVGAIVIASIATFILTRYAEGWARRRRNSKAGYSDRSS